MIAPASQRVLMTSDTIGGVWTYAMELIAALAAHDVEVALATMGAPLTPAQAKEAAALTNVQLFESGFKLEWMDDPWGDVQRAGEWLLGIGAHFEPDVVHLNGYAHAALPWTAPVIVVAHSCVLSWWRAVHGDDVPDEWSPYRCAVRNGLKGADLVVAPSRAMLAAIFDNYGSLDCATVIHNGLRPPEEPGRSKEQFIFTAGRLWDQAKNISAIAASAARIHWPVYMAGDYHHPNGTGTKPENVRLLGRLSREALANWYERASIFALPCRYEPFGLSALEAALAGNALVLGDIPSQREIWGDAALFVPPNDPEMLAGTLNKIAADTDMVRISGAKARSRALRYTTEQMSMRYMEAYRNVSRVSNLQTSQSVEAMDALPSENRRYSRLETCATSGSPSD